MFTFEEYSIYTLLDYLKGGFIRLDLPIQRKSRWDKSKRVLFIHSILTQMLPFNIILIMINKYLYVCDGKQRILTIQSYRNNEFSINQHLCVIYVDIGSGETIDYDLYGKFYKDLPVELKIKFDSIKVVAYKYKDISNELIIEVFSRINNGVALNAQEGYRTVLFKKNPKLLKDIDKILKKYAEFFSLFITEKGLNASDDLLVVLRLLCLIKGEKTIKKGTIEKCIDTLTFDEIKQIALLIKKIVSCDIFKNSIQEIGKRKLLQYIIFESKYAYDLTEYCKCIVEFFDIKFEDQRNKLFNGLSTSGTVDNKAVSQRMEIFYNIASNCKNGMYYRDIFNSMVILPKDKNTNININNISIGNNAVI